MNRVALLRVLGLGVLGLGVLSWAAAFAQTPSPQTGSGLDLTALEQTAQKSHGEWEALAKDLDERIARILPCDPRYTAAIADVSRASDGRLAALAEYLRGVSAQAFAETAEAKILLAAAERRAIEAGLDRADTGQEQTAVDIQSDALAQSVKQRASLEDSQKVLAQIAAGIRERSAAAELRLGSAEATLAALRGLVAKFDARDASLRDESAAFDAERGRWTAYYAARRARSQVECSITQIGTSPARGPARGKQ
jgi:hypothetical protein